jgi:hypothetical protein
MKNTPDDQAQGNANWMQSMTQARNNCRQALMKASVDVSDPSRALWPAVPRDGMTREHETVAQTHAALLDYVEHIEPYSARCAGLWTVEVVDPHEFPSGETLPVVLSELEEWADMRYEEETSVGGELNPRKTETEIQRVHLPSAYARAAFNQANKCVERLKLGLDIENRTAPTRQQDPGLQHGDD